MENFDYPIWIAFPLAYGIYIGNEVVHTRLFTKPIFLTTKHRCSLHVENKICFSRSFLTDAGEALLCTCDKYTSTGVGSSTCAYLRHVQARTSIEDFLAFLKCSAPEFHMFVECYHYQTYHRTQYYTDSHGRQMSRHFTERRKVVTHRATSCIQYGAWKDCSTQVGDLDGFRVIRMKFEKDYEFHDEETYNSFVYQRLYFQRVNDFDEYQNYREEFVIPDFTNMAVCSRHGERPCCMNLCFYILASIFMLSHPYRVWMSKISAEEKICIRKRVSASPLAMQHLPCVQKYLQSGDAVVQKALTYQVRRVVRCSRCGVVRWVIGGNVPM